MQLGAEVDGQLHIKQRLFGPEPVEERRQVGEGEVLGDPEPDGVPTMPEAGVVQSLVGQRDDAVPVGEEALARGREPDRVGVPVQQRLRKVFLELADAGADGRLAQAQPARGAGEAQLGGHGEEAPDETEVKISLTGHRK